MPVIPGRNRVQLRQSIGYNLGAIYVSSASSVGTTTTIVDNTLIGGTDDYKGRWIIGTSGTTIGQITRVSSFTGSTLTVSPAFTALFASGETYEMWTAPYNPLLLNDLINQAIMDTFGLYFDPEEDISLCGDGRQASFAIPTSLSMIDQVSYRSSHESLSVEGINAVWAELVQSGLSAVRDNKDYKSSDSLKITVTAAAAANARITTAIASLDLSGMDYIEFWFKSSIATLAGDIHLLLDDTAQAASAIESLALPALVANTWTFVRIALATPNLDTAIISVGLRFTTDNGAQVAWLGPIRAVLDNSAIWTPLNWGAWTIDEEAVTLKLRGSTAQAIGNRLIKLRGGDAPVLLTADATVNEVDDTFVICRATELAVGQEKSGTDITRQLRAGEISRWARRADAARAGFPYLINARTVR